MNLSKAHRSKVNDYIEGQRGTPNLFISIFQRTLVVVGANIYSQSSLARRASRVSSVLLK